MNIARARMNMLNEMCVVIKNATMTTSFYLAYDTVLLVWRNISQYKIDVYFLVLYRFKSESS